MKPYLMMLLVLLVAPRLEAGNKKFWILAVSNYASAIADVELTQSCIRSLTCREGNPLLPSGRKKAYPIQLGISTVTNIISYKLMKSGSKHWWLPQVVVIAGHGVGVSFGLRFKF